MAWPDLFTFAYWTGFGQRTPEEVRTPPADPRTPPVREEPRTAGQFANNPYNVGVVTSAPQTCTPPVPPGDYPVWRAMDADPALTLSRAVITAPIREADKGFKAREGTPDEWVKQVQDAIDPLWAEYLREALDGISMGWKPFEPVYGRRENRTVVADLKPLAQELTTVLVKDGVFAGLRNQGGIGGKSVDLPPVSSLVVTIDCKNRNPYGRPWHENCRDAWWAKIQCLLALAKLNRKASGIQGKVFYPPASDEATAHTNETKAKGILASYMNGDGVVMPNAAGSLTADLAADFRNIQGLAEAALWKIEIEDHGNTGAQAASIIEQLRFHNVEMSRGWHVPERAAQEANTAGSRADSETSADTATKMSQQVYNDICGAVRPVIDRMLVNDYGEAARGAVWVDPGKLRDVFADADWKLIDAVLAQPDLFMAVADQVDLDAVFTRRGIPKNAGVLTLTDAVTEAKANRNKQQQALVDAKTQGVNGKPVNGQANGNGRLAMARSVEWLGRIIGGEDDEH